MELTAAKKLGKMIVNELDYKLDDICYWTDSMTVLKYLKNDTSRFQTFVANRIAVIRDGSSLKQWKYVNTKENPADCASRGLPVKKFLQCKLWFKGPSFLLSRPESEWLQQVDNPGTLAEDDPDVKCSVDVMSTVERYESLIDKALEYYCDWHRLKKAIAWLLNRIKNLKSRVEARKTLITKLESQESDPVVRFHMFEVEQERLAKVRKGYKLKQLTADDLWRAERALVQYVQRQHWQEACRGQANGSH
ncbi:uncharacterized protein LOC117109568 [Anneissia japonica]|uniref:uncharacterized protein LOC117109568 n=1 Tax=Anneissia japonica TaxID=1529436 RepID=UPI0014259EF6|nr:uncharacterized protein LOC117109568 [Anneissia japonica]